MARRLRLARRRNLAVFGPQWDTDTLIDLDQFRWPSLHASSVGLEIAATGQIVELYRFDGPAEMNAAPCFAYAELAIRFVQDLERRHDRRKHLHVAASGPYISLTTALEATYTLWPRDAAPRDIKAIELVTGNHANVLRPGELLRSIKIPAAALGKRFAFRRASLTHLGRSSVLVIGTQDRAKHDLLLTITASTPRPMQMRFWQVPSADDLRRAIDASFGRRLFRRRQRASCLQASHDPLFCSTDPRGTRAARHLKWRM